MSKTPMIEMECPECGTELSDELKLCPGCGVELDWTIGDDPTPADVNGMLDEIIKSSGIESTVDVEPVAGEPSQGGTEDDPGEDQEDTHADAKNDPGDLDEETDDVDSDEEPERPKEEDADVDLDLDDDEEDEELPRSDEDEESAGEGVGDEVGDEAEVGDEPLPRPGPPRVYARTFSRVGLLTTTLALLCVIGLVILLNWDVWVKGDAEAVIGETQRLAIISVLGLTLVLVGISVADAYRSRRTTGAGA